MELIPRMISIVIGVPEAAMIEPFEELRQRAGANVFLHPAALCAAAALGFARIHVLMAWVHGATSRKLVGFWALRERRVAPFWPSFLATPPYDYAFVSSPVIDPDHGDAVWPAFFDSIAADPRLPKVIKLKLLDADAATHRPMMAALQARRLPMLKLAERARPFLSGESDRKRSGSTAKKLRQDWNRLSALGRVDIANDRTAEGARAAFEVFLELELRSWKGQNGTALLSDDEDAAFTRRLIADLTAHRSASVALLRVDGKPIAAQVLLYSATMAYTWKTAFDAAFSKFSPGALLIDKVSDELFAGGIAQIESCSSDGGFMEHLWTGRRMTLDLLIDVGPEKSAGFTAIAMAERGYAWARGVRNRLHAWNTPPKQKTVAATRS
jgi:CelD/BcsL family acetyltransferase involved in cellulose biosynthesis